jgi:hypothetical protein
MESDERGELVGGAEGKRPKIDGSGGEVTLGPEPMIELSGHEWKKRLVLS